MKLTKFEKFMYWLGYRYILNKSTKEIHRLSTKHKNCRLELMSNKNKKYISTNNVGMLFAIGYNGCKYCYKDEDID
jgi:hypothetical protein